MIPHSSIPAVALLSGIALLAASCSTAPGPVIPNNETERKMLGLLQKFDRWDDNGDGELDHSELTAAFVGTTHQADRAIDFYDTNRNQRISLREAQAGYERAPEAEAMVKARNSNR